MRDASTLTILATAFLACSLQVGVALSEETPLKATNDDPQIEDEMTKRDWNKDLHIWGKRAWRSLQDGWGKRAPLDAADEPYAKRAWQSMPAAWGKRRDDAALRAYLALLDAAAEDEAAPQKRAWNNLGSEWGKRSRWDSFGPSWGKRDPAWPSLKGMWGKRADDRD